MNIRSRALDEYESIGLFVGDDMPLGARNSGTKLRLQIESPPTSKQDAPSDTARRTVPANAV